MGILDDTLRDAVETVLAAVVDGKATLTRTVEEYDEETGSETVTPLLIASVRTTPPERFKITEVDGDTVKRTDMKVLISAQELETAEPEFGTPDSQTDTLTRGGVTYRIQDVIVQEGGDRPVFYELVLRA